MSTSPSSQLIRRKPFVIACILGAVLVAGLGFDYWSAVPMDHQAVFVGRQSCVECHPKEAEAFRDSHHDLAMDLASDETVLADFNDTSFTHHGVESLFYRDGEKFMVRTEGESGEMEDFEVKYVFGVEPLQQYMVEFAPSETSASSSIQVTPTSGTSSDSLDGSLTSDPIHRLQVLRLCWNVEKEEWFYLAPPDVAEKLEPDDPLHWTGIAQRWQTMCAECHSTNLKKNFDVKTASYHTTFSEMDVSCEACHGPASLHIELAQSNSVFWDRNHGYGLAKLKGEDTAPQLDACAPCHSRRGLLDENYLPGKAFDQHYQLETLGATTYHVDGQIKDEVYVYGSFIQSKMYHKSIRCTDCHDPHSLKLKHPGNETCTSCHQHAAGKYDVPSHHHHQPGTPGAMCVNCHMPHTTYMAIDDRRDHSLRVPRPDLSVKLGTPNACSSCHVQDRLDSVMASLAANDKDAATDQSSATERPDLTQYAVWLSQAQAGQQAIQDAVRETDQWCDEACERWYGTNRQTPQHYAEPLAAFRAGEKGSAADLLKVAIGKGDASTPDIARATAWRELQFTPPQDPNHQRLVNAAKAIIDDPTQSDMVRAAAVETMRAARPHMIRRTLIPALDSDSTLIRNTATRVIVETAAYQSLTANERSRVDLSLRRVKDSLMVANDRAGAHMSWGMLCERSGNAQGAINAYQTAIRLEPTMAGPRTNLASLMEQLAPTQAPPTAKQYMQFAQRLRQQELPWLIRDAKLAPDNADIQYRCGLALYLADRSDEALLHLENAVDLAPEIELYQTALELLKEQLAQDKSASE